jgi:hypothetical protein
MTPAVTAPGLRAALAAAALAACIAQSSTPTSAATPTSSPAPAPPGFVYLSLTAVGGSFDNATAPATAADIAATVAAAAGVSAARCTVPWVTEDYTGNVTALPLGGGGAPARQRAALPARGLLLLQIRARAAAAHSGDGGG